MALFSKATGPKEKKDLLALLKFIVDGTRGQYHGATVPSALAKRIEKLEPGLVSPQSAGAEVDPAGNIVVFATSKGVAAIYPDGAAPASTPAAPAAAATEAPKSAFVLRTDVPVPESKRGGFVKTNTYPFDQMEVGSSFFVAATEERPNPAKALASTVSSATKRNVAVYPEGHEKAGQATGKNGARYVVRNRTAEDKDPDGIGARVFRVA